MYDFVICNGLVIDGSGAAPFCADVAVRDGKIVCVGKEIAHEGKIIDATGLVVTPGFIDSHSHSDKVLRTLPEQKEKLEQGITTCVAGQCGASPAPTISNGELYTMGQFLETVSKKSLGCNHLCYVGHGAIRRTVMGNVDAVPSDEQLQQMKQLLRDAMDAGALGLSFGLMYNPGCYCKTDELVELAKVVAEYDGVISAHIRNEGDRVEEALEEFIQVLRLSGVRGVYSHHKACGMKNHGKVRKTIAMLEQAKKEGIVVWCDVYPYIASSTSLTSAFVDKAYREGTAEDISLALSDENIRQKLIDAIHRRYGEDLSWVLVTKCNNLPEYVGLTIAQIAQMRGTTHAEAALDVIRLNPSKNSACYFSMSHDDMKMVLAHPDSMICTDSAVATNVSVYHPRLRGSFPRALGRYVREEKLVPLEEMIRKMTSLPAEVYRIENKGYLRAGYDADICVFDPETICDCATFQEPTLPNTGLRYVFVGGKLAVENNTATGVCAGRVILAGKKGQ